MTDKPYVPSTEQVRSDATQLMDRDSFDRWLAARDARIVAAAE